VFQSGLNSGPDLENLHSIVRMRCCCGMSQQEGSGRSYVSGMSASAKLSHDGSPEQRVGLSHARDVSIPRL